MYAIFFTDVTCLETTLCEVWEGEVKARQRFAWILERFENVRLIPLKGG